MEKRSIGVRDGYDAWAVEYDGTENPVVWMDARVLPERLTVERGSRVLDAGCGTGRNVQRLLEQGALVTGIDFSAGMLRVAREKFPEAALVRADLQQGWPFRSGVFDLVVCALVGEHLGNLDHIFTEMRRVLTHSGRLVFSVYHPAMALAGKEARFVRDGIEYRLGAFRHLLDDYVGAVAKAGFTNVRLEEFTGPPELGSELPGKAHYVGFPLLIVVGAIAGGQASSRQDSEG
jgi:SAM-dependent methyltransferase